MAGMNALAQQLAPADGMAGSAPPLPPGDAAAGADPMAALAGQDPAAAGGEPVRNPYPTADPDFMSQVFQQLLDMQNSDHQQLAQDQQAALQGNPMFEALMQGAPLGPGAGQDGQAIAPGAEMPTPGM